jgi:hypothetical protein
MIDMENINLIKNMANNLEVIKKSISSIQTKRWLTVTELSKYLGYSKDRIYKFKESVFIENLHFYKKQGKILFDRVAIDDWIVCKDKTNETNQSQRQIVDNILSSIKTT